MLRGSRICLFALSLLIGAVSTAVADQLPVPNAGGPYATAIVVPIYLDASASYDLDADAIYFKWDFDNDGLFDDATGAKPEFAFVLNPGVYVVGVYVWTIPESLGYEVGRTAWTTVTVGGPPPTSTPEPASLLLLGSGLAALVGLRKKLRK
jgi:PEP-CTERM motif